MNNIIEKLKKTIDKKLHLQQNQQSCLIPDKNTNIQVRALHEHSMGFSLDVPDSKQKPLAFFSSSPPRYLAKICDALIAVVNQSKLYLFAVEIKSKRKNNYNKQLANGRHFWCWLIALFKEHGYLPLKPEPLYIAVLIWKPRKKQVRKGVTAHRSNSGVEIGKKEKGIKNATQKCFDFDARFEIKNHGLICLSDLIKIYHVNK